MPPRFLVPDLDPARGFAVLPDEEAHHLARVLRLGVGDEVAVFDGRGRGYAARVASLPRGRAVLTLAGELPAETPPHPALTLVQAVLKREAMDDVVRDATMIGAAAIQPIVSARTTTPAPGAMKAGERWSRVSIASAKQCRRMRLPELRPALGFAEWCAAPFDGPRYLLVEPSAVTGNITPVRTLLERAAPSAVALIVGPEGGWSPEECDAAVAAGCEPVSLGRLTLRADAAGLVAAGMLLAVYDS